MSPSIRLRCARASLALGLTPGLLALAALATGCRTFENAGNDLDRGLRTTQQDLQHGIRGEPENSAPPPAAASTAQSAPPAPGAPATTSPPPAASGNGISL